jgi:HK97 family phage prohead protease
VTAPIPAQQPVTPPPNENIELVIAAIVALLLLGGTQAAIIATLATLNGSSPELAAQIWADRKFGKLVASTAKLRPAAVAEGSTPSPKQEIQRQAFEQQVNARASYLTRATRRLSDAYATGDQAVINKAKAAEDRFVTQHNDAVDNRAAAAKAMQTAVKGLTPNDAGEILLGWYTDDGVNTCMRCHLADGTDFNALVPPPIGWPGTVHLHCHCKAGPAYETGERTEVIDPNLRASNLQHGKGSKLWKYWTKGAGLARWVGHAHEWTALRDALLSEGVPVHSADGLATNIYTAVKGHGPNQGKKKRTAEMTETRAAQVIEVRGDKPNEVPGFTARLVNYGVPDTYRTSWKQGVFTDALAERANMPVVWNHDWSEPVGRLVAYRDSAEGLDGDVEFDDFDAVPRAKQAYAQVRSGTMAQFSFAFVRGDEEQDPNHRGVMMQTRAGLQEFSLVLNGSVPGTHVTSVRSAIGTVDPAKAVDIVTRFSGGQLDLAGALLELRSAAGDTTPEPPRFEFRALGDTTPDGDPTATLAAVDAAMANVAEQLNIVDVEAARRYFQEASSRLCELQYLLGMIPGVTENYTWRAIEVDTVRSDKVEPAAVPSFDEEFANVGGHLRVAPRRYRTGRR